MSPKKTEAPLPALVDVQYRGAAPVFTTDPALDWEPGQTRTLPADTPVLSNPHFTVATATALQEEVSPHA